jgi:hypothetical protein
MIQEMFSHFENLPTNITHKILFGFNLSYTGFNVMILISSTASTICLVNASQQWFS